MNFELLKTETLFSGRAFDVLRQTLRMEDGRQISFDIVDHPGAITIVPVDDQGRIWFVRQYRFGARQQLLELPAGTLNPAEDPGEAARREVREEIGMAAGRLEKLGEFFLAPGYSSEYMHVYLATELYPSPLEGDEDEFLEAEGIEIEEAYRMALAGELADGKTLAALLLVRARLEGLQKKK